MSALIGKYFKPAVGSHYKTRPTDSEEHRGGTFTAEVAAKVPTGFEVVGEIEHGHALVRLPNGHLKYMDVTGGQFVDPPPPPRPVNPLHREILDGIPDPAQARQMAAGFGYTEADWSPIPPLDVADLPSLRGEMFRILHSSNPEKGREALEAFRQSEEGQREIAALAQHRQSVAEAQQASEQAAQARPNVVAYFRDSILRGG